MLIRRIVPIEGNPRVKIRLRPRFDYGAKAPTVTYGSNHIRFVGDQFTLRLTTDAPIDYLLEETAFKVTEPIHLILGPDETLPERPGRGRGVLPQEHDQLLALLDAPAGGAGGMAGGGDPRRHHAQDVQLRADRRDRRGDDHQHSGSAEQRAATGTIAIAGCATRFSWCGRSTASPRVRTLENYFRWIMNIVDDVDAGHIQPVFGIALERKLTERTIDHLPGYRGMGPVRVGNQAHEHFQHDTYGNLILAAAPAFFDTRLIMSPGAADFSQARNHRRARLPALSTSPTPASGSCASRARIHTSSTPDVLGRLRPAGEDRATASATPDARAILARRAPRTIRDAILARAWSTKRKASSKASTATMLDASVLLMSEVGFIAPDDPRFVATRRADPGGIGNRPSPDALRRCR